MAIQVFEMFGRLSLDKSEYDRGIDQAEKSGSSFADKLNRGLGVAAKGIAVGVSAATGAVVALTKSATDGYASYEQLKGGVETLFKDSAGVVMEYASQAYKTAGLSANQYMETTTSFAASLIQSLGGDTQAAADVANRAVIDMSDNANKMGTNMGSIQDAYMGFSKQNYTMLDNLKLGYGGTKTEMERLIEDASKMTEEQGRLNVSVEAGNMSFANIVNAISVMQAHLGLAGTTAQEAGTTIQGSASAMKAAWDNLLVGMADDTQDMGVLIDNLVNSTITMLEGNLIPRLQTILGGIGEFVARAVGVLGEQLPDILQTLLPPLLLAATSLFTALADSIPMLLEIILQQIPMVVDAVAGVIPTLVGALIELLPQLLDVGVQIIISLVNGVAQALPDLIPAAVEAIATLLQSFYDNLPLLIEAGLNLLLGLAQGLVNAIPQLVAKLPQIINSMVNYFSKSVNKIAEAGVKLLNALVKSLPTIIQTIVAALPQIISSIVQFFTSAIPQLIQAGIDLLVSLVKALPTIIKTIVAALPQIIQAITKALTDNIPALVQAGFELFVALIQNLPEIIATIIAAVPDIISGIVETFGSFVSSMWNIGKSLAEGIWTGLKNAVGWIKEKIKGWVGDVFGFIKRLFGIASPSKLMRDQIGLMLGKGVAEGIVDSIGDIEQASGKMLGAIPDVDGTDFSVNVRRNLTDSYSGSFSAFVEQIEDVMRRFEQTIIIELNDREMARAVRGYV